MVDLTAGKIPEHIGVILDGNRRFAKRLMLQPWKGHEWGAKKVREFCEWCKELGIKRATFYSFSIQNFNRPKEEFDFLMDLFEKHFREIADGKNKDVIENEINIKVIGRIWMLPEKVQSAIRAAEEATKNYRKFFLNFAIAYGGQEEITDAVIKIAKQVSEGLIDPKIINEDLVRHTLYTNGQPYPDLIIRTGGERRISNFLLWQSAYSEFIFLEKAWPELTKEDFFEAIEDFQKRERRFGR